MSAAELRRRCHARGRLLGPDDAAVCWDHAAAAWLTTPAGVEAVRRWGEAEAVARETEALVARALPAALAL
jgi:hypothetical protein